MSIPDLQSIQDLRNVFIDKVGICRLRLPLQFSDDGSQPYPTVGIWGCYVSLPKTVRGTHMSRLVRILHDEGQMLTLSKFEEIPRIICGELNSADAEVTVQFPCFFSKDAPISRQAGFLDSDATLYAQIRDGQVRQLVRVATPVTTLCPCSKSISDKGAHNQRGLVTITVELAKSNAVRLRDLIGLAESCASSELYPVLKRVDEKYVTERAYDNPKFVEDVVRDCAVEAGRMPGIVHYRIEAENFESIHNHSAYAMVQSAGFPAHIHIDR